MTARQDGRAMPFLGLDKVSRQRLIAFIQSRERRIGLEHCFCLSHFPPSDIPCLGCNPARADVREPCPALRDRSRATCPVSSISMARLSRLPSARMRCGSSRGAGGAVLSDDGDEWRGRHRHRPRDPGYRPLSEPAQPAGRRRPWPNAAQLQRRHGRCDAVLGLRDGGRGGASAFAKINAGILVERKRGAVALHYRLRPELEGEAIAEMVRATQGLTGITLIRGKMVIEAKSAVTHKGYAIEAYPQRAAVQGQCRSSPAMTAPTRTPSSPSTGWAACRSRSAMIRRRQRSAAQCRRVSQLARGANSFA